MVYDVNPRAVTALEGKHVTGCHSLEDFVAKLERAPGDLADAARRASPVRSWTGRCASGAGDIVIDGGNSYYQDDINRAKVLLRRKRCTTWTAARAAGCGVSSAAYSLMIGGEEDVVTHLDPIFKTIAPGDDGTRADPGPSQGRHGRQGYLRCGPNGAGHFVKMVHNGIEYGMMASIGEGLSILKHANVGKTTAHADAETSPVQDPQYYQYDFKLDDVAEVWRHGSVISSWLVDLTADALTASPDLRPVQRTRLGLRRGTLDGGGRHQ